MLHYATVTVDGTGEVFLRVSESFFITTWVGYMFFFERRLQYIANNLFMKLFNRITAG